MFVPLVLAFIFLLLVKLWSSGRKSDGSGSVLQSGPLPKPSSESDEKPSKRKALPPRGSFAQVGLRRHNEKRALHGSKAMKIDNSLCTLAQSWADELARTNNFMHSTDNDLGENIYAVLGSDCDNEQAIDAVDSWYSEIKDYNFNKPGFSLSTGHFTQVVWKESLKMGMAKAKSDRTQICYVVAKYSPQGNFGNAEDYEANVPRPL